MIHFLDTSALAKRYVSERGSSLVRLLFRRRRTVAASRVAFAELAATIARLAREGAISVAVRDSMLERLPRDFVELVIVEVRARMILRTRELVTEAPLRGYDAVQLASALALKDRGASVELWTADGDLASAARSFKLRTVVPG